METKINKQAIQELLFSRGSVTVPFLQAEFSADYQTVRGLLSEMEQDGAIELKDGLNFVAAAIKPRKISDERRDYNSLSARLDKL